MGQCGQGHCNTPITKPTKVVGLDGVPVHQIVAGTSHSLAWTALPSERYVHCAIVVNMLADLSFSTCIIVSCLPYCIFYKDIL